MSTRRRGWRIVILGGIVAAVTLGAVAGFRSLNQDETHEPAPEEQPPDPWTGSSIFKDMTAGSGVSFTFHNGEEANNFAILESLGGGVGMIDYDGDGLLDLFFTGGGHFTGPDKKTITGHPCALYKNLGGFKFKDVTREVGLDQPPFYNHGVAVCDYDKDGWPDLLVTGYGRVALYHNVPGPNNTRIFKEVTKEIGLLGDHFWGTSAAWADFDGDGWPDLYCCQYANWSWANNPVCGGFNKKVERDICPPRQFQACPNRLWHNISDGKGGRRFVEVGKSAGLRVPRTPKDYEELTYLSEAAKEVLRAADETKEYGKALGVIVVDVNNDGKPDIYVANDEVDNFLYINLSKPGQIRFEEVGMATGVAKDDQGVPQGSMGADAGDPYGSGLPALWVTNFDGELHALYRNDYRNGHLSFQFSTAPSGLAAIGQLWVGFGTGFIDVDNDGWEDIFISNGHVVRFPYPAPLRQRPILFLNRGQGKFKETRSGGSYFQKAFRGRGLAIGDLDNDGRPDVVANPMEDPIAILRNTADVGNHWLGIKLAARDKSNCAGARLVLDVNGRKITRFGKGGGSYLSANDPRQLLGLGKATQAGKLTLHWPTGTPKVEHWDNLPIDRYHTLAQGSGTKD